MVTQAAQPAPPKFNVNTPFKDLLMSDRFNCTDAVATALIGQGLSSVDVFLTINEDDVDSIVKTIRKPATGTGEYDGVEEPIPDNMPEPRGKELVLRLFKDSDHAGDKMTRRSRTGYIIYGNNAPLYWLSRRQGTCETSVFGAEFVALKQGLEQVRALRYKLRMMGIPVVDPCWVFGDNMSVVNNVSRPESVLKKKAHAICYHYARESTVMGESMMAHVRSENNPADICTKVIPGGMKRDTLVGAIMYNTTGDDVLMTWKQESESG